MGKVILMSRPGAAGKDIEEVTANFVRYRSGKITLTPRGINIYGRTARTVGLEPTAIRDIEVYIALTKLQPIIDILQAAHQLQEGEERQRRQILECLKVHIHL